MKKKLYLFILLGISILATLGRAYSTFFVPWRELTNHLTGDAEIDAVLSQVSLVAEKQYSLTTSYLNKFLIVTMVIILIVSLFYLIRRDLKAVYFYLVYLFLTLIKAIYDFMTSDSFATLYSDEMMRSTYLTGVRTKFVFSVVLLFIYLLVLYVNNRKQSGVGTLSSAGVDI